jgi:hypothetical protein
VRLSFLCLLILATRKRVTSIGSPDLFVARLGFTAPPVELGVYFDHQAKHSLTVAVGLCFLSIHFLKFFPLFAVMTGHHKTEWDPTKKRENIRSLVG